MTMIRSRAVLSHARGQNCQLALPGICSHDPSRTVFAHLNGAAFGKGAGNKAHDIAGFFADDMCHMAYDLHTYGLTDAQMNEALLKAVVSTWVILINDDVIKVPRDKPKPRIVAERKPRDQRASIKSGKTNWPSRSFNRSKTT